MTLSYVLPVATHPGQDLDDLTAYLEWLSLRVELVIVDGSPPDLFAANQWLWGRFGQHLRPSSRRRCLNGEVQAVLTGLDAAAFERTVVAHARVRYTAEALATMETLLSGADVVRPQEHLDPVPWHALWETARILVDRATVGDHRGTLGVRRSTLLRLGGHDGDALFGNVELVRTVRAGGGRVIDAPDLFVRRLPGAPSELWREHRRQAYEELAEPVRFLAFLGVLPASLVALRGRRWGALALAGGAVAALAEMGRRRDGGDRVLPARASALAPLWVLERGLLCWAALAELLLAGGHREAGALVRRPATPESELRRRLRELPPKPAVLGG